MTSKSDIIYRKLVLAHKLISDSDLLKSIVDVEEKRKNGSDISLLEILLKKNQISPDDGLILRSEHDKVMKLVKEKTTLLKTQTSTHLEKTINETVEKNADAISAKKTQKQSEEAVPTYKIPKRKQVKRTRKKQNNSNGSAIKNEKPKNGAKEDRTVILPKTSSKRNAKSSVKMLEVDADPDMLERSNYDPAKDPLVGKVFGGCKLISKIGEGGMGSVYKAYHIGLDKNVALKLLPPSHLDSADRVKRFKHEAKSAAKMEHPNIVQILNIGEDDNIHFIVMQYIDGEDLRKRLLRKGVFPPIEAIDICVQVAEGLSVAHKKGIVHRDIKPDNIMIEREGNIKITDFGLARQIEQGIDITKPGKALGTPYYMSPEQCSGKELDGRSDIYSLGVTLYHIVTGRRPFKGKNAVSTALMHIREPVTPPEKINPNLPIVLADIILRMMEKEPKDRYQNSDELIKDLKEAKDRILNAPALDPLSGSEGGLNSEIENTLISAESVRKHDLAQMRKKIGISVGVGVVALVLAIIIIASILSDVPPVDLEDGVNPTGSGKHGGIFDPSADLQEKIASENWERTKKELEQMKKSDFFVNALAELDKFIKEYKDRKAAKEAEKYKADLQDYIKTKRQQEFDKVVKLYDEHLEKKEYVNAKEAINSLNVNLKTKEIEDEINRRIQQIDKLIKDEWWKVKNKVDEFLASKPKKYFDALELLKNASNNKIDDPEFVKPLEKMIKKVQEDFDRESLKITNAKIESQNKQKKQIANLTDLLKTKLGSLNFSDSNVEEVLKNVKKEIGNCDKYSYVLPVFELIERDLQAINLFRDVVINKCFGRYANRGKPIEITTKDGNSFTCEVLKSSEKGIEINAAGVTKKLSWQELSPAYLAKEAYDHIKPNNDIVKCMAVPLFLLSIKEYDDMTVYLKKLPVVIYDKISWRFHYPSRNKELKDNWTLFSIYYAEIIGLDALSKAYLVKNKKQFQKVTNETEIGLRINPKSGWCNIAKAMIIKLGNLHNIRRRVLDALETLDAVQEDYTDLKAYLMLYADLTIELKNFNDARKCLNTLDKNFSDDEDVYILWAKYYKARTENSLAYKILLKAQSKHPYSRQVWLELKKLK